MEDKIFKFNMRFQRCDQHGHYWGDEGWFNVEVYAINERIALKEAKKITHCEFVRALKCSASEVYTKPEPKTIVKNIYVRSRPRNIHTHKRLRKVT